MPTIPRPTIPPVPLTAPPCWCCEGCGPGCCRLTAGYLAFAGFATSPLTTLLNGRTYLLNETVGSPACEAFAGGGGAILTDTDGNPATVPNGSGGFDWYLTLLRVYCPVGGGGGRIYGEVIGAGFNSGSYLQFDCAVTPYAGCDPVLLAAEGFELRVYGTLGLVNTIAETAATGEYAES